MVLKRLELNGFKSFAKNAVLEFKSPITAIVGPNGSGKSNITEAFRFVLGEQSMKSLRGKRGEDLIWNGSPELGRSSKASARIIFDNRKKLFNIDFDDVEIERAVFRDGLNEYFLNDSQIRLKDIFELLAPTHIGPSGHHIISQGEADKILNAPAKERREMVEDALGLRLFHYRKQESEKKLSRTEENIKQVESLRKELSPHIKFLKRQYEKLQKTKELRTDLLEFYIEYFSSQDRYLGRERENLNNLKSEPAERLKSLKEELHHANTTLSKSVQDEKRQELIDLEKKLKKVRDEKSDLVRSLGRIEGQETSLEEILNSKKREQNEKGLISRSQIEDLKNELSGDLRFAERSGDLGFLKGILRKVLEKISQILNQEGFLEEEGREKEMLQNLKAEKRSLEEKVELINEEDKKLSELFQNLQKKIEAEKDVNRDLEKSIFKLRAEESEILAKISRIEESQKRLKFEEDDFERELKEAKVLVGEAVLKFQNQKSPELSSQDKESKRREIEKIKIRLEDAGGIGEEVEKEYNDISERDSFLEKELSDLEKSALSLKQLIKDLEIELDESFKKGIDKINSRFQELFALMFNGGSASLITVKEKKKRKKALDDLGLETEGEIEELGEDEPEQEGLDIKINLPRKKIRALEMLSGGERALTSIALIFALSQVNPPPFLVLDETDAALDEANSKRYGDMIESLAKSSQLILITHNRETMSRAGILYGVTMGREGFSKILSVAFDEAVAVAK